MRYTRKREHERTMEREAGMWNIRCRNDYPKHGGMYVCMYMMERGGRYKLLLLQLLLLLLWGVDEERERESVCV